MNERLTLWDWARRVYAAPGVQDLCLELQDAHGQSVCLMLWAAWAASVGRRPDPAALARAAAQARTWQGEVIDPLRGVRRRLKTGPGPAGADREALRGKVGAAELAAEQALLAALEAQTPFAEASSPADLADAMTDACAAWGSPAPRAMLEALAAAFPAG